jgi:hypothetical protein
MSILSLSTKLKTAHDLEFHIAFINFHLREILINEYKVAAIIFVLLSLILFLIMLIGSTNGSVNLNKFTFEGPVSEIFQRKSITFTLLGFFKSLPYITIVNELIHKK